MSVEPKPGGELYTELSSAHLASCTCLYVDVFNGEPWNDRWTLQTAGQRLQRIWDTPGSFGLIACREEPVAFAAGYCEPWQERTVYFLKEMCVRADLQGQGIGSRLLGQLERELAQRHNVSSIYLLTMRGDQAETFYARCGYQSSERMVLMSHRLTLDLPL